MRDQLLKIFSSTFDIDLSEIHDSTSASNTPSWDSFNNIRLIAKVRQEFHIDLSLQDALKLKTFKGYFSYLKKQKKLQ